MEICFLSTPSLSQLLFGRNSKSLCLQAPVAKRLGNRHSVHPTGPGGHTVTPLPPTCYPTSDPQSGEHVCAVRGVMRKVGDRRERYGQNEYSRNLGFGLNSDAEENAETSLPTPSLVTLSLLGKRKNLFSKGFCFLRTSVLHSANLP